MKKHFWWIISALTIVSVTSISWGPARANKAAAETIKTAKFTARSIFDSHVINIYHAAKLEQAGLDSSVFQKAVTGFYNLKATHKMPDSNSILTVIDFTKPSTAKRMWIIDLQSKQLLLNTWVAHGHGSGDNLANQFSNNADSHQSSLGFYLTDDIYFGKHGRSLRLDGLDEGFNTNARSRSIVVHAANYVCQSTINQLGRIGRSFGCPAVSPDVADEVINTIKGKTVMFINGNAHNYTSKYLDENLAADAISADSTSDLAKSSL